MAPRVATFIGIVQIRCSANFYSAARKELGQSTRSMRRKAAIGQVGLLLHCSTVQFSVYSRRQVHSGSKSGLAIGVGAVRSGNQNPRHAVFDVILKQRGSEVVCQWRWVTVAFDGDYGSAGFLL